LGIWAETETNRRVAPLNKRTYMKAYISRVFAEYVTLETRSRNEYAG